MSIRRLFPLLALAVVLCAAAATVGGPPGTGGELRFAVRAEPKTLDPHVVVDEPSQVVAYLTGGGLVRENRLTQELEPALATRWRVLEGGRRH